MRSVRYLPQLLTVFVVSAAAATQSPWGFPIERHFVAASINGQNLTDKAPTFVVTRDMRQAAFKAGGSTGCNRWTGAISFGQSDFDAGNVGTTRMFCADQMMIEAKFIAALTAAKRWHMDGASLVLEGEQSTLRLIPASLTQR